MPNEPAEPLEPGTPLPWILKHRTAIYCEGYYVADTGCNVPEHITVKDVANAAYIVEACNNYLALRAELAAEREKNAKLSEANGKLMADAVCDDIREKVRKLIAEHGVLDDDLWAALKTELDAEREKVERLEGLLRRCEGWLRAALEVDITGNLPVSHLCAELAAALNPEGESPGEDAEA